MDKEYMLNVLSEILTLILWEDVKSAVRVCRREIEKLEMEEKK